VPDGGFRVIIVIELVRMGFEVLRDVEAGVEAEAGAGDEGEVEGAEAETTVRGVTLNLGRRGFAFDTGFVVPEIGMEVSKSISVK
jgi:hypothetical protein